MRAQKLKVDTYLKDFVGIFAISYVFNVFLYVFIYSLWCSGSQTLTSLHSDFLKYI